MWYLIVTILDLWTLTYFKLEYEALIWNIYSNTKINKIEIVQREAACCAYRRWETQVIDEFEWSSFETRRVMFSLFLFHKIHIHCLVCILKKTIT